MTSPEPVVSVIVPAYGVSQYLGEALTSLQAQTVENWEAIVVDDGAPDDVAGAVAPFLSDPRIRFLQTDNGGLAVARNRGAKHARAPRIALLDGDDLYRPRYIEAMMERLDASPRTGFVTCDAIIFGMPEREGRRFSEFESQARPITLDRVLLRQFNVFGSCMIRREAFEQVGGYSAGLRSAEDLDLWVRLLAAGWAGDYVDEPLLDYRRRPGSLSASSRNLAVAVVSVHKRFAKLLEGRPEHGAALEALAAAERKLMIEEGEIAILDGRAAEGVRLLHKGRARDLSPKWRMVMPVLRIAPMLAPPLLRYLHGRDPLARGATNRTLDSDTGRS